MCCHIQSLHALQLKAPASEPEVWELIVLCMSLDVLFLPSAVERAYIKVTALMEQKSIVLFVEAIWFSKYNKSI